MSTQDNRTLIELQMDDGTTRRVWGRVGERAPAILLSNGEEVDRLAITQVRDAKSRSPLDAWLAHVSEALEGVVGQRLDQELTNGTWLAADGQFNGVPFRIEILGGRRLEVALRDGPRALGAR